jgi:hypothetical protein
MLPKYKIEYAVGFHGHEHPAHHTTDDPVAAEEFLCQLLERGFKVKGILHEGVPLARPAFDRMVKTAAGMLATKSVRSALGIDSAEAHARFSFPA